MTASLALILQKLYLIALIPNADFPFPAQMLQSPANQMGRLFVTS